jgi:hypothetical protein
MLIRDNYSAEDLALQCLKLGAAKVYVASRHGQGAASFVAAWPGNRVERLDSIMLPCGVADDGNRILMVDEEDEEEEDEVKNAHCLSVCQSSPFKDPYGPVTYNFFIIQ